MKIMMEGSPSSPSLISPKSRKSTSKINNKQAMKVVYISNPMKVKASSASEFRALVQELTGKDSYWADDHEPARVPHHHHLHQSSCPPDHKGIIGVERNQSEGVLAGVVTDDIDDEQLIWSTSLLEDMLAQPLNIKS
ncbi:hypothetical protein Sjap_012903 [Stephania japonica]|uniref:VQ domain-containing protein n=1 Tax=Stephania japonica TaxID=461633 RepID=A0AAP0IZE0_9MAGN